MKKTIVIILFLSSFVGGLATKPTLTDKDIETIQNSLNEFMESLNKIGTCPAITKDEKDLIEKNHVAPLFYRYDHKDPRTKETEYRKITYFLSGSDQTRVKAIKNYVSDIHYEATKHKMWTVISLNAESCYCFLEEYLKEEIEKGDWEKETTGEGLTIYKLKIKIPIKEIMSTSTIQCQEINAENIRILESEYDFTVLYLEDYLGGKLTALGDIRQTYQ